MRKKILAGLVGSLLFSSVAFAAPVNDLLKGETAIGLDITSMKPTLSASGASQDLNSKNATSYFIQNSVSDKVMLGLEGSKFSTGYSGVNIDLKATDFYAQYKLNHNVNLMAGTRSYDTTASYGGYSAGSADSKFLWGVSGSASLGGRLTGYASYKNTADEQEWQVGVTNQMTKNVNLDLSFKSHDYELGEGASLKLRGVGVGLSYRF